MCYPNTPLYLVAIPSSMYDTLMLFNNLLDNWTIFLQTLTNVVKANARVDIVLILRVVSPAFVHQDSMFRRMEPGARITMSVPR